MEKIRIVDLFAGIGGIRLGFEQACKKLEIPSECIFTSEIDKYACQTYRKNFNEDKHDPECDITKINEKDIPDFDVLLAGFPCQAFSTAGLRAGFEDTRGTLFFDVARIIKEKQPSTFLLENVKGLTNHKGGKTLETIMNTLKDDLQYNFVRFNILNSKNFGVPQNRERIYIIGFKNNGGSFKFPDHLKEKKVISDILEEKPVSTRYYLSDQYLNTLVKHKERHKSKGNGFGYEIKSHDDIANTILIGGMGKERNLIIDKRLTDFTPETKIKGEVNKEYVRKMTPMEWERLQGFPDNWTEGVANQNRYKQLGNSVAVPVVREIAINMIKELLNPQPLVDENSYKQLSLLEI